MDWSKYLFRCSSLGHLMTEPQGDSNLVKWQKAQAKYEKLKSELDALPKTKKDGTISKVWENKLAATNKAIEERDELYLIKDEVELSETAKVHLSDIHTRETTGRQNDISNKYIEKGLMVEEDGITVYSRIKKKMFIKNETHLKNLYIMGTPDIFEGKSIHEATSVPDIKCSWDVYTFRRTIVKKFNPLYYWQLTGYMWLTGAKTAPLAYCLVNTPEPLIASAEKSLWFKLGCPDDSDENFINACAAIRKSMIYDDIPLKERMLEYILERQENDFKLIEGKVIAARKYLQWLDDEFNKKVA